MILIDKAGVKYKAVKSRNEYYLILEYRDVKTKKIEVKGKDNVLRYIKSNGLKKYIPNEEKIKEEKVRKGLKELSWWIEEV